MKRKILAVVSALGLALILSSCSELSYELSEVEQQELGVESISAGDVVQDILNGQEVEDEAGDDADADADDGHDVDDADAEDADAAGDEEGDGQDADAGDDDADAAGNGAGDEDDADADGAENADYVDYYFRSSKLLNSHYEKHGIEMGFASAKEYEKAASDVVNNPDALHKIEAEDGDDVYYVEETNEFVVVSTDGYIRTYFNPGGGIDYYNRQ